MPHVIVTGGPGAGKTTLLHQLGAMGYATVEESARAIIAERLARGASRRPPLADFAREILQRDVEKYRALVCPPWEAIYATDSERDQSFGEAVEVYQKIVRWYRFCGYEIHEIPRVSVAERADHVLGALARNGARRAMDD